MAQEIKTIPVLTGKTAKDFIDTAASNMSKVKLDFSEQINSMLKILGKAKIN